MKRVHILQSLKGFPFRVLPKQQGSACLLLLVTILFTLSHHLGFAQAELTLELINTITLEDHSGGSVLVEWNPHGDRIAARSGDTIYIWDSSTDELLNSVQNETPLSSISWSPDGTRIAAGGWVTGDFQQYWTTGEIAHQSAGDIAWIWDSETGYVLHSFEVAFEGGNFPNISSLDWSPNSLWLAGGGQDNAIHIWNLETGGSLGGISPWVGPELAYVNDVAWKPDSAQLAAANIGGIYIWDADARGIGWESPKGLFLDQLLEVTTIAWSPDGTTLASGSVDGIVRVWDTTRQALIATLSNGGLPIRDVEYSPDGTRLASTDGNLSIWDTDTGQQILEKVDLDVISVSWSPDGSQIAIGTTNGEVQIWNLSGRR
jgi:WD40 repeat protein